MQGLAGFFIARDDEEAGLRLPDGQREIAFLIQDRRFKNISDFDYAPTMTDVMTGFLVIIL